MLWHALEGAGAFLSSSVPGALIGGIDRRLGTGALGGNPSDPDGWFAVEACEYDRSFLKLFPFGAAITNVEGDHLDYYGSLGAIEEAFARFADRIDWAGVTVVGREVPERVEHASKAPVWRLGRELGIDLLGERRGCFRLPAARAGLADAGGRPRGAGRLPGRERRARHGPWRSGVSQRTPAGREADPAGLAAAVAEGIGRFQGVGRRFEPLGRGPRRRRSSHDYAPPPHGGARHA